MTQENRNGLDHLMKAFDCAENAQKAFAAAGNIEGARIAQEASNKIYLSMEAAMRTCKRSEDVEEFAKGGRVRYTYTFAVYESDDYGSPDPATRFIVKQRSVDPVDAYYLVKKKYPGYKYFVERLREEGGVIDEYGTGGMMSEADYYANGGDIEDLDTDEGFMEIEEDEMFRDGGQIELPL